MLPIGSLSIGCDSDSGSEPSSSATTSPTSITSGATTSGATTNPATTTTTATSLVTSSNGTASSSTTNSASTGGGAANTDGSEVDTSAASNSSVTTSTTGGPPSGTPYVFTGSTDGSLRAFVMDPSDGSLVAAGEAETGQGLDFIALGPDNRTLFIAREASLAAYAYDPTNQTFTASHETQTEGGGTYVSVDPTGGYVFVASYNEGLLSFFDYDSAEGFSGGETVSAGMNAHQVRIAADGRHVYVPCLGEDYVAQFDFDPASGALTESAMAAAPAAGGPRHMTFHPSAPVAYVLTENSSQIHVYDVNESDGTLALRADASVYTADDETRHWSSDIQITPDGKYVYAVNRDEPTIVRFEVAADHSLVRLGSDELAAVVRAFAVDPAGDYLQIGGDDGNLVAYRIDAASGTLTQTASLPGLGNIHATIVRYLR